MCVHSRVYIINVCAFACVAFHLRNWLPSYARMYLLSFSRSSDSFDKCDAKLMIDFNSFSDFTAASYAFLYIKSNEPSLCLLF